MTGGLLLLWNDVDARRRAEYDCWHTVEHVPERTWVPGYRRSTRYALTDGAGATYFTRYELEDLACLESVEYKHLVAEPTRWSASMRPSLCNFLRRTYDVLADVGSIMGSQTWVRRMVLTTPDAPRIDAARASDMAETILNHGAMACVTRVLIGHQRTSGPQAIANVDTAPAGVEYVCLIDTAGRTDPSAVATLCDRVAASGQLRSPGWRTDAAYGLLSSVRHVDVRAAARPAPRDDLAARKWD